MRIPAQLIMTVAATMLLTAYPSTAQEGRRLETPDGAVRPQRPGRPPVIEAGTTLKCGSGRGAASYYVTTGSIEGKCDVKGKTATCYDKGNNKVSQASCGTGCGSTAGSGECASR
jgi:hypothetical protein